MPDLDSRAYSAGQFKLEVADIDVGYLKKFEGMAIEGDLATQDCGPDNRQKKNIANFKWTPGKATVGMGMGRGMYNWIKASFDKAYYPNHGALISADFNYRAQTRLDFRDAIITSVTVPKLSGDSKEAAYFDIEFDPEQVEWQKGGGEDIRSNFGTGAQKRWLCSNFKLELGDLPTDNVASIDTFSWKCSVVPNAVGCKNIFTKHPCKVSIPNLKLEIAMSDYERWADRVRTWFVGGSRREDSDEMHGRLVFLDADIETELGEITLENVGFVKFSKGTMEANADKIARFNVELYVEKMDFKIGEYDA